MMYRTVLMFLVSLLLTACDMAEERFLSGSFTQTKPGCHTLSGWSNRWVRLCYPTQINITQVRYNKDHSQRHDALVVNDEKGAAVTVWVSESDLQKIGTVTVNTRTERTPWGTFVIAAYLLAIVAVVVGIHFYRQRRSTNSISQMTPSQPQRPLRSISEMRDLYYSIIQRNDLTTNQKEKEIIKLQDTFDVLIEGTVFDVKKDEIYVDVPEINANLRCSYSSLGYSDLDGKKRDRLDALRLRQHVSLRAHLHLGGRYIIGIDPFKYYDSFYFREILSV